MDKNIEIYGYRLNQELTIKWKDEKYTTNNWGWLNTTTGLSFYLSNIMPLVGQKLKVKELYLPNDWRNKEGRVDCICRVLEKDGRLHMIDKDLVEEEPELLNLNSPMCMYQGNSKIYEPLKGKPMCVIQPLVVKDLVPCAEIAVSESSVIKLCIPLWDLKPLEVFGDDGYYIEFFDGTSGVYLNGEGIVNEELEVIISIEEMMKYDCIKRTNPTNPDKNVKLIRYASDDYLFDKSKEIFWQAE